MTDPSQPVNSNKLYTEYLEAMVTMTRENHHKAVEALELMDIENEGLKATLSEALGMLRDGLRAYEDEQYASVLEGFVRDAVTILEEIE